MPNLAAKICLVTGASRGIGRGIAIQLVGCGATCYITGRSKEKLELVVEETKTRGYTGKCIAVECDHANDENVEKLFQQISNEQNGKLDLLVNNAYAAVTYIINENQKPFWDQNVPESWDIINNVGLRNHYICSVYAARMMVPQRSGLIVNVSSVGGKIYFQMPQYGIGKGGKDRMAKDCGLELEKYNVAFLSLWPGAVKTELVKENMHKFGLTEQDEKTRRAITRMFEVGESTEFSGKCISYLLADPNIMKKTGQIHITTDLAAEYKFKDIDGSLPICQRSIRGQLRALGFSGLTDYIPTWIKMPAWLYHMLLNTFKPKPPFKQRSKY